MLFFLLASPKAFKIATAFYRKFNDLSTLVPAELERHQTIKHFSSPPWQLSAPFKEEISSSVPGIAGQVDDIDSKRWFSLTLIASYQVYYTTYTDGSTSRGTRNGGTEAVATRESPVQPEVETTTKTKGRMLTSTYEEESAATESALTWTSTNVNNPSITTLFCKDSKSLFKAVISSNHHTSSIHNSINSISFSTFIQWILDCSLVPVNKLNDKAPKKVSTIVTNTIHSLFFSSSIQLINQMIRDDPPTQEQVVQIYEHQKASWKPKQMKNRKDNVVLTRLRSDHHPSLYHYLHQLDPTQDSICSSCPPQWTRPYSLALQMSCRWHHKTTSVWEPHRVLRATCDSTWRCDEVCKGDLGRPWCLTKND